MQSCPIRTSISAIALLACALVCVMGAAAAQQADDAATPQNVKPSAAATAQLDAVSVTGSRFSSEQLAPYTELKPGSTVTRADLQAGADHLSALGLFAKVGFRFNSAGASVHVEYQVTDAPGLPILFDNFPWASDEDLKGAIKAAIPFFDGTAPESGKILDDMASAMALFLERKGIFVKISHSAAADPLSGRQVLQFLSAGAEQDVKSVDFSDALASNDRNVQERLADLIGKPYSLTAIELFEVEQVRPLYFRQGYLRAAFKPVVALAQAPTSSGTADITVHVQVDPGSRYMWGGVTWSGNSALSTTNLNGLVDFKTGDPADGTKIGELWNRLIDDYGQHGYLDATATPAPQYDEQAHRVNYTVVITEGKQYHMGKLVLSGLSMEGERRIREAWLIPQGGVFDEKFFNEFIDTGAKEAFAGIPFNYEKVGHFLDKNAATGVVDVMIDFQ